MAGGAQQAFDLLGKALLGPGSVVAVENPGYPLVRLLYASHGAQAVGVPMDAEGIVLDRVPADARLIYVTPARPVPARDVDERGAPRSPARARAGDRRDFYAGAAPR
ncbi:MAG TPA: hypothetical protein VFG03_02085 [Telluria sp.]|nr:hypothetical protein [Telluria sp.]